MFRTADVDYNGAVTDDELETVAFHKTTWCALARILTLTLTLALTLTPA